MKHSPNDWTALYIERWLKAPIKDSDGIVRQRHSGTPQGGVISPLLANLFMHYAFDRWITDTMGSLRFVRYADDAVVHCKSQAEFALTNIAKRFSEVGLELNPAKTRIVYCKDENRIKDYENVPFTFLGYTFRLRKSRDKYGRIYVNFLTAVSRDAVKVMRQTIRNWHIQLKSDQELLDIGNMFHSTLRGWHHYDSRFYESAMYTVWKHLNRYLARWMRRKYKQLPGHKRKAAYE